MENETKLCKHCKSEIPKGAKVCPNCRKKQGGIGKWIVIVVVVVIIIAAMSGGGEDKDKNPQKVGEIRHLQQPLQMIRQIQKTRQIKILHLMKKRQRPKR